jgi:hypothetical protein
MTFRGGVAGGALVASLFAATARVEAGQAQPQRGAQAPVAAPAAQDARVLVTVVDPSGLVIQDATVTLVGLEDTTKNAAPRPAKTSDKGSVIFDKVLPGRYTVQGEFPGFELGSLKDVRIRSGDNKHIIVLPLKGLTDSVTVSRERQEAAADRVPLFGTALTREQIELLSEDPAEMRRQLMEMAGPDAIIRVDSFEGRDLPPKAQIKSVHITRDQFAAESHYAGGLFVEIVTQPGLGPLRGSTNLRFRDSSMDGVNPFTTTKPATQNKNYGGYVGGTLVQNKASFSLNISGSNSYVQPNYVYTRPDGTPVADVARIRSPSDSTYFNGYLDWAMTRDQTLRLSFGANRFNSLNQGVGQYDHVERAYDSKQSGYNFMLQEVGPLGRRFFMNTRFYGSLNKSQLRSKVELPTVRVNDEFTAGGAQQAGGRRSLSFTLASDVDYVKGMHSWRAGVSLDGYDYRSDEAQNYLGTYTFATLEDFNAGKPRSYTQRIGNPLIDYFNMQAAFYLQDDVRIRKNLTITPGVRYEAQTHLGDYNNLMPRVGITWAPFKSGKTTLRASYGIFYDWISTGVYEQTLRVDGFRQQEVNISNPSYPDPIVAGGVIPPTNRYLYSDNVVMPQNKRLSAGANQQITRTFSVGATYSDSRATGRARGHNLNAPLNGIRPEPTFSNVVEVVSDASAVGKSLSGNFSVSLAAPSPALQQKRFNWRRTSFFGSFGINRSQNNTDGPFAVPVSNTIDTEWGPSGEDIHYRFGMSANTSMLRNLNAGLNMNVGSAPPYTIRTGYDDNGDLVFNDRPVGVGRNTERASGQFTVNANFSYTINLGSKKVNMPPGISITSVGGVMAVTQGNPSAASRYRISINANIFNITNHYNYVAYSGIMTSSYFRQPTNISGVRRIDLFVNFSF